MALKTYDEIGAALGISGARVQQVLDRAVEKMRFELIEAAREYFDDDNIRFDTGTPTRRTNKKRRRAVGKGG